MFCAWQIALICALICSQQNHLLAFATSKQAWEEGGEKPSGELALIKIKGVSLHNRVLGDDTVGLLGQMALKGFDSSQASWLMLQYKHHESRAPLVGGYLSIDCSEAVISSPYKCLGQLNLITAMCKAFIQYAPASWLVHFFYCSYEVALTFLLFIAHKSCSAGWDLLVARRGFFKM